MVSASYAPAYVYGGPTRSIAGLCAALKDYGLTVIVLTTKANGQRELLVSQGTNYLIDGVPVRYFNRWTKDHSQLSPGLLWKVLVESRRFDIVHIQSWWNLVSVGAAFICWCRGIRPVVSLRGTLSEHSLHHRNKGLKAVFHKTCGRFLLRRSFLHVTSDKEEREVHALIPGCQSFVLPNIIRIPERIVMPSSNDSVFRLVYIGRIDPIKNLDLVIRVLRSPDLRFPWSFDIIGTGSESYMTELKASIGSDARIRWLGNLDGDEKLSRIARSDLLVLLSHSENFGNVVVEALSQGTAVLVSEHVGVASYVRKKHLGWVVPADVSKCVTTLNSIWSNKSTLTNIRDSAPDIVQQDFSWHTLSTAYSSAYQAILIDQRYPSRSA